MDDESVQATMYLSSEELVEMALSSIEAWCDACLSGQIVDEQWRRSADWSDPTSQGQERTILHKITTYNRKRSSSASSLITVGAFFTCLICRESGVTTRTLELRSIYLDSLMQYYRSEHFKVIVV